MSAKSVRDMSMGEGHELAIALDKAGFTPEEIDEIIHSPGNQKATLMLAAIRRVAGTVVVSKGKGPFVLLSTVPLTVPTNFFHETQIASFLKAHRREFGFVNDVLTDRNFAKATQRLVPGKTYQVKTFGITSRVTSEDCLGLYKAHNGILTGAQGLTLAWQEARGTFPVGKWTVSFDEKDAFWTDSGGDHRVPGVRRDSGVDFLRGLGVFGDDWDDAVCVLVFCDC